MKEERNQRESTVNLPEEEECNQKHPCLRGGVAGQSFGALTLAPLRFCKSCQVFPSPLTLFGLFPICVRLFLCVQRTCYYMCSDVNEIILQS